jgi:two-component system, chemotaxis family, chemotaxis protein CheY
MARILVVDDALFTRKLIAGALATEGHQVVGEADNGVDAVARFASLRPDLTTLDIRMPNKDGLAALAEIMTIDPHARVVMCSAAADESKVIQSINLGAKDFVVKPIQPRRLLQAIEAALTPPRCSHADPCDTDEL